MKDWLGTVNRCTGMVPPYLQERKSIMRNYKRILKQFIVCFIAAVLVMSVSAPFVKTEVYADELSEENEAGAHSGKDGGVKWSLSSDGFLEVTISGDLSYTPEYNSAKSIEKFWPWYEYKNSIKTAKVSGSGLTQAQLMFARCYNMTNVDIRNLDTSKVTNMNQMFMSCFSINNLDLGGFDTKNVKTMYSMFNGCGNLKSVNISSFDTSNVNDMFGMFGDCTSLVSIDMSIFNTSKVRNMSYMFVDCKSVARLDLGMFDMSKVTKTQNMLSGCDGLKKLITPKKLPGNKQAVIKLPHTYANKAGKTRKEVLDANDVYTLFETIMYRLYNPNSGEHFYTSNLQEIDNIVAAGWINEGLAWKAPVSSKTPVYRLYNPNAGDHHYTTSASERDSLVQAGWKSEGIGWYSDDDKGVMLHRLYNPNAATGSHHYTTSSSEKDNLVTAGWKYEGTAWYGID